VPGALIRPYAAVRNMTTIGDTSFRLIIAAELLAMVVVRDYYFLFRSKESVVERMRGSVERGWLTATLVTLALFHFGAVIVYVARPSALAWSAFQVRESIRWCGIAVSVAGAAGEVWGLLSLGASYNPLLRVGKQHTLSTAGAYRWIRHPLYSFALPLTAGWGIAASNWFIIATGIVVTMLTMIIRAPREETMMLEAFGEPYRAYMERTGRFFPRVRAR